MFNTKKIIPKILRRGLKYIKYHSVFWYHIFLGKEPVFIYQMGKVGSSSIYLSLKKQYRGLILHGHTCPSEENNYLVDIFYKYYKKCGKIKIISLYREPIGKNVSDFFQNLDKYLIEMDEQNAGNIDFLKKLFLKDFKHNNVHTWFDTQLNRAFNIDVYSKPIKNNKYSTFDNKNVSCLVLDMTLDDVCKQNIISEFLGLGTFKLERFNEGDKKSYSNSYKEFKSIVRFPHEYITEMTNTKYFNHFFDEKDKVFLHDKWQD